MMAAHRNLPAFAFLVLAFAAPLALAFFPPEDSRDGVTASFVGFDEASTATGLVAARRDAGKPFEIRLDIANATGAPVSGDLAFWLNDDWDVGGAASRRATIPPHSTNSFFAIAVPKPGRVLPALYPIHASFSLPGGEPLHPIAVFLAAEAARSDITVHSAILPQPLHG
ncbi:MAG: hypothetical protein IJK04_03350, partial [Kiritimatiellae bacterium]|nr:hypothetical protein [Kiritimatiellia bacterium]